MHHAAVALATIALSTAPALARSEVADPAGGGRLAPGAPEGPALDEDPLARWSGSATAFAYVVANDTDYIQLTFQADHDWLHLEARYNYEDLDTGSFWAGGNIAIGDADLDEFYVEITPIAGVVFGRTDGVGIGYQLTVAVGRIEFYTEGEYVFDSHDASESFFYSWSELSWMFTDVLRAGVVLQRTKVYESASEIEGGVFAGLTFGALDLTAYVLNPGWGEPTVVLGLSVAF